MLPQKKLTRLERGLPVRKPPLPGVYPDTNVALQDHPCVRSLLDDLVPMVELRQHQATWFRNRCCGEMALMSDDTMHTIRHDNEGQPVAPQEARCWIEKEVVRRILDKYAPDLVINDQAPIWAVVVADAYACTVWCKMTNKEPGELFRQVREDDDLQDAVVGSYRLSVTAYEIMSILLTWRT